MAGENDPKSLNEPQRVIPTDRRKVKKQYPVEPRTVGDLQVHKPGGKNNPESTYRTRRVPKLKARETEQRTIGPAHPRGVGGKQRPGKPEGGYKREDISYACEDCGRIYEGPHTGERVPLSRRANPDTHYVMHKGHPVSHGGGCTDPSCQGRREAEYRRQIQERYPNMGRMGEE